RTRLNGREREEGPQWQRTRRRRATASYVSPDDLWNERYDRKVDEACSAADDEEVRKPHSRRAGGDRYDVERWEPHKRAYQDDCESGSRMLSETAPPPFRQPREAIASGVNGFACQPIHRRLSRHLSRRYDRDERHHGALGCDERRCGKQHD